jgi:hypothetical protein
MAKNFVIYESRNRLTGTLMRTLDLKHADCPPEIQTAAKGKRYAATCVDHNKIVFFDEHYPAGRAIAHSGEAKRTPDDKENGWCPRCVTMVGKGDKVARPAKVEAAPAPVAKSKRTTKATKKSPSTRTRRAPVRNPEPQPDTQSETETPEQVAV